MILDTLAQLPRYTPVHPLLAKVQAFTETENWDDWGDGRHELIANQLFVILAHDQGRGPEMSPLESHRNFIDVQIPLAGQEIIGWSPRNGGLTCRTPYNAEADIEFWQDPPQLWLPLQFPQFVIFFPEDAHAPLGGSTPIRKAVFKLAVNAGPDYREGNLP